jgi:hypothetical protein
MPTFSFRPRSPQPSPRHGRAPYLSLTLTRMKFHLASFLLLSPLAARLMPQLGYAGPLFFYFGCAILHCNLSPADCLTCMYRVSPDGIRTLTCGSHLYRSLSGLSSLLGCNNLSDMRRHSMPPASLRTSAVGCSSSVDVGFRLQERRLAPPPCECFIPQSPPTPAT